MGFHRLTVPSYTGGLPGGYDYINNAVSGTPALADGSKVGGLNSGTYFVGLADDSTSEATNRPHNALAENCDILDDLFHRDIAVRVKTALVTAGGAVSSISVSGAGQYFGEVGTPNTVEGIATFAEVLDGNGDLIFSGGVPCRISSITGATPGDGFVVTTPIVYNISPSIPSTTVYQLYYSQRGNLAQFPVDIFTKLKTRPVYSARIAYEGGSTWANGTTNPSTSVELELDKIITDLAATTGADCIGSANTTALWMDGNPLGGSTIAAKFEALLNGLAGAGGNASALLRAAQILGSAVFTGAPITLSTGSLTSQLYTLLAAANSSYFWRSISANATLDDGAYNDAVVQLTGNTNRVFTLTSPIGKAGRKILLERTSGTGTWDLQTGGLFNINGTLTYNLTKPYGRYILFSNGSEWCVLDATEYMPAAAKTGSSFSLTSGTVSSQLQQLASATGSYSIVGLYRGSGSSQDLGGFVIPIDLITAVNIPVLENDVLEFQATIDLQVSGSNDLGVQVNWAIDGLVSGATLESRIHPCPRSTIPVFNVRTMLLSDVGTRSITLQATSLVGAGTHAYASQYIIRHMRPTA